MTTYAQVLAAIKQMARINATDTTRDTQLGIAINAAYRDIVGSDLWDFKRTTATQALTAGTQNYDLPADFDRMAEESLFVYQTNTTNNTPVTWVVPPDADLWEQFQTAYLPQAARTIAGSTPVARRLRLLPNFSAVGYTLFYAYYARQSDISGATTFGSEDIADAVMWNVLSQDADWNRDMTPQRQADYNIRYQVARKRARTSLLA